MARKIIDVGLTDNDGTGDSIRDSFKKVNDNFQELYSSLGLGERLKFTGLDGVPGSYLNQQQKILVVNNNQTGMEFRRLIASTGLSIVHDETAGTVTFTALNQSIVNDKTPALGGNLNATSDGIARRIINLGNPVAPDDAAKKSYVDGKLSLQGVNAVDAATGLVNRAWGTMTGPLVLSRNPRAEDDDNYGGLIAATKSYVDGASFASTTSLYVNLGGNDNRTDIPDNRKGRSPAYAFRTLERAVKEAERIITESLFELSVYAKTLTYNDGLACTLTKIETAPNSGSGSDIRARMTVETQTLSTAGTGYRVGDVLTVQGGSFTAQASYRVLTIDPSNGAILTFQRLSTGNYSSIPGTTNVATVATSAPGSPLVAIGAGARFNLVYRVTELTILNGGTNYGPVSVTISGGGGSGASAVANVTDGVITTISLLDGGTGYTSIPTVTARLPRLFVFTGGTKTDFSKSVDPRSQDIREGLGIKGAISGAVAEILNHSASLDTPANGYPSGTGDNEMFDVGILQGEFIPGEQLLYGELVKNKQITIQMESGVFEENLPLRIPANISLIGEEFRRTLIRPKPGISTSPYTQIFFRRDPIIDNLRVTGLSGPNYADTLNTTATPSGINGLITVTIGTASANVNWLGKVFGMNRGEGIVKSIVSPTQFTVQVYDELTSTTTATTGNWYLRTVLEYGYHYLRDNSRPIWPTINNIGKNYNASTLLNLNRYFLQKEVVAYVNTLPGLVPYNQATCERDVGLMVDALAYDLVYGSYTRSVEAALKYYQSASGLIAIGLTGSVDAGLTPVLSNSQKPLTLAAIAHLGVLADKVLTNTPHTRLNIDPDAAQVINFALTAEPGNPSQNIASARTTLSTLVNVISQMLDLPNQVNFPKNNAEMDVFLNNDANIIRQITIQGHGGMAQVLDPEGQILTKSPYSQQGSVFSASVNKQSFRGGIFVDGYTGNQRFRVKQKTDNFTLEVDQLFRRPQLPCIFTVRGISYKVNYLRNFVYNPMGSSATLVLDSSSPYTDDIPGLITNCTVAGTGSLATITFATRVNPPFVVGNQITVTGFGAPATGYNGVWTVTDCTTSTVSFVSGETASGTGGTVADLFELITAGNRSILSNDWTQLNDMGYGLFVTNGGQSEAVGMFTYYCYNAYYALNGGQIRSVGGSSANGVYALRSEGSDPKEIPDAVRTRHPFNQPATIYNVGQYSNAQNGVELYVDGLTYTPLADSQIEILHYRNPNAQAGVTVNAVTKGTKTQLAVGSVAAGYFASQDYVQINGLPYASGTLSGLLNYNINKTVFVVDSVDTVGGTITINFDTSAATGTYTGTQISVTGASGNGGGTATVTFAPVQSSTTLNSLAGSTFTWSNGTTARFTFASAQGSAPYTVGSIIRVTGFTVYPGYNDFWQVVDCTTTYVDVRCNVIGTPTGTATIAGPYVNPFVVGQTVNLSGINPAGYNGTVIITGTTPNSISYSNATTTAYSSGGTISPTVRLMPRILTYTINSINTASLPAGVIKLVLASTTRSDGTTGLFASVPNDTPVTIRQSKKLFLTDVDDITTQKNSTALLFDDDDPLNVYSVINYTTGGYVRAGGTGEAIANLRDSYTYMALTVSTDQQLVGKVYHGDVGSKQISVTALTDITTITKLNTGQYVFGHAGTNYRIMSYESPAQTGVATGRVNLDIPLVTSLRGLVNAYSLQVGPGDGFTYSVSTCQRDVGYVIDAVGFDAMFDSNLATIKAALSYYRNLTSTNIVSTAQKTATVLAFTKTRDALVAQASDSTFDTRVITNLNNLINILSNGPTAATAAIAATNTAEATTTATGTSGTPNITVASGTGIQIGQLAVATGIPSNTFVISVSGTAVVLSRNLSAGLSTTAINFYPVYKLTDPTSGTNNASVVGFFNARRLIESNRQFIIEEIYRWIEVQKAGSLSGFTPGFTYDYLTCQRDIGLILDAVRYDLTYGGNTQTQVAARSYYTYGIFTEPAYQLTPTVNTLTRLSTVLSQIAQATTVTTSSGNTRTQDTSGTAGTVAAANFVTARVQTVIDTVNNGYTNRITITTIAGGGTFTTSAAHDLSVNDTVTANSTNNGLVQGTTYFVASTPATNTFTLSATIGGSAITTFTNGTGLSLTAQTTFRPDTSWVTTALRNDFVTTQTQKTTTQTAVTDYITANVKQNHPASITIKISTVRATAHDVLDIGTGSYADTNYPNNIFGVPANEKIPANEAKEVGKGRVFYTTIDQEGNFKVGKLFGVNQSTGEAQLSAKISLTNISSIQLAQGEQITNFSSDAGFSSVSNNSVTTDLATQTYIDRRLGQDRTGANVANGIGPGYISRNGGLPMLSNLDMGNNGRIINLLNPTGPANAVTRQWLSIPHNKDWVGLNPGNSNLLVFTGTNVQDTSESVTAEHQFTNAVMTGDIAITLNGASSPITVTAASWATNTATITYDPQGSAPFTTGQSITVAGMTPSGYNGTYTVLTSTGTQTTYTVGTTLTVGTVFGTIRATRTLNAQINSGVIIDADVNSAAAIDQAKLNLTTSVATAVSTTGGGSTAGGLTVAGASCSGTTATITFAAIANNPIPFTQGRRIIVSGMTPAGYNGTWTVLASPAPSSTAVSFTVPAALAASTVNGTVIAERGLSVFDTSSFTVVNGYVSLKGGGITLGSIQSIADKTVIGNASGAAASPTAVTFATVVNDGNAVKKSQYTNPGFLRQKLSGGSVQDSDYEIIDSVSTGVSTSTLVARNVNGDFAGRFIIGRGGFQISTDGAATGDYTALSYEAAVNGYVTKITGRSGFSLGAPYISLGSSSSGTNNDRTLHANSRHDFTDINGSTGGRIRVQNIEAGANNTDTGSIKGRWSIDGRLEATYADLAEYYESDKLYEPGTVLVFGGNKEVTTSNVKNDHRVAGVVSTDPAYVMNNDCPGDKACVALVGRVPCKVIGTVRKGDLMVTSGIPGVAIAANGPVAVGTLIGKAIENYDSDHIGTIQIAVGRA